MTTAAGRPPTLADTPGPADDPLAHCLDAALEAAGAADVLGLDSHALRDAHAAGLRRTGFPGDAYVLALVGGTGVGKSSLLNALAGSVISQASARRPTTSRPLAWVPRTQRAALEPLLEWLGVEDVREHGEVGLGPVAILDLPDMDSVAHDHRARVESLLPRVDAVAWVTDPEKYADAVLHDDFFRSWLPRLDRQVVIVNKADRLADDDGRRIRTDLEDDLTRLTDTTHRSPMVVLVASTRVPDGLDDLRAWLAAGTAAKQIVRGRIAAAVAAAGRDLADAAGLRGDARPPSFLDDAARAAAVHSASSAVLRAIDLGGLERQAIAATRAVARARGTGPLGRLTTFVDRASGRETNMADPNRYLLRWRDRGALGPAVEAVREAVAAPLRASAPAIRPALAAAVEPSEVRLGLERSLDQAIGRVGHLEPPSSRWWHVIGTAQTLATAGIALSAAWVVVWILVRPATGSLDVPAFGPMPSPFVSLVAFLIAGYALARLIGAHAGWQGSRWAARVRERITSAVEGEVRDRAFEPLDRLDDARRTLTASVATIERTCRPR